MSGQKHQPEDYKKKYSKKADSRLMQERGEKRSGSDSDAHSGRKQSRLHEDHKDENAPLYDAETATDFTRDLNAHDRTGEEHGEFVARSNMVADVVNAYVPKKETDYLLWNRLNQVETPARLDETSSE